jgi:predicted N-acetyltransferase YhbS
MNLLSSSMAPTLGRVFRILGGDAPGNAVSMSFEIRQAQSSDAAICARICFEAFGALHRAQGFAPIFPSMDIITNRVTSLIANPNIFSIVAEDERRIVCVGFLSETDPVRGVGPIAVDPAAQTGGVGRSLMDAVLQRAGSLPTRLLQETFNLRSMALYASLGFDVKDLYVLVSGRPSVRLTGYEVRPMNEDDLEGCERLQKSAMGFSRINELRTALRAGSPWVAVKDGSIAAFVASPFLWIGSHGAADDEQPLTALLAGAAQQGGKDVAFLLPVRSGTLFRWALANGMKAGRPMTLMSKGQYSPPKCIYVPSVVY